jgi:uncharacterized protein (TIGR02145 family)
MLDNLKYAPGLGSTATLGSATSPNNIPQLVTTGYLTQDSGNTTTAPNQDTAKYIDPIGTTGGSSLCRNIANISPENITKCGLLYNFYTATAGTAPQSQYTGSSPYQQGYTASGSICPTNWHLPTGYNASGDFGQLDIAYGGTGAYQSGTPAQLATLWRHTGAWRGLFSGLYTTSFANQGSYGYFWSSSVVSGTYGYYAVFTSSVVYPGTGNNYRYYGLAVRCVL